MNIEKQVCSREQGEKLAGLGIDPFGGYFCHNAEGVTAITSLEDDGECRVGHNAPAYTLAELGAMLAEILDDDAKTDVIPNHIFIAHGNKISTVLNPICLADVVIYLLENNHITAEQVNSRLNK